MPAFRHSLSMKELMALLASRNILQGAALTIIDVLQELAGL